MNRMKNRPLIIIEPQAHKKLSPSLPITPLSEDSRDFTDMNLVLLVSPGMDFYTHVGMAHYCDHLRRNYWFDVVPAERFW